MVVRVKVKRASSGGGEVTASAIVNTGFESEGSEVSSRGRRGGVRAIPGAPRRRGRKIQGL
ncbi:MAG: hypothetical protein QXE79_06505 [Candidatus Bathyarchaeia archaeon]